MGCCVVGSVCVVSDVCCGVSGIAVVGSARRVVRSNSGMIFGMFFLGMYGISPCCILDILYFCLYVF